MEQASEPKKSVLPKESVPGNQHTSRHNQYEVDVYKLIHLTENIPEAIISTDDFKDDLRDVAWADDNGKIVSPQDIINAYQEAGSFENALAAHPEFSRHLKKIESADLSFPIIVFESRIIDGVHRFVKAILEGHSSMKAKIIEQMPDAAIIKIHESHE